MENKTIDLKSLTMDELAGVVNIYPWYAGARVELCGRMAGLGADSWGESQFADQAMYVVDREIIAKLFRRASVVDYSDDDLETLLASYIDGKKNSTDKVAKEKRIPGGDFFTRSQYEEVRRDEDAVFARFKAKRTSETSNLSDTDDVDFCTETMAGIYAEQGYYEEAIRIYDKLILAFPEKSAYFASLIDRLRQLEK